jgi:O-antigen/teichoic acid export membrane protein
MRWPTVCSKSSPVLKLERFQPAGGVLRARRTIGPRTVNKPTFRVAAGVAAHIYAQSVTIVTQLATLPIFLSRWTTEQYGQWIVLSAIPVYLTIADFGIVTAAGNLMSMHKAREETAELNRVFKSSLFTIVLVVPVLGVCTIGPLLIFGFGLSIEHRFVLAAFMMTSLLNVGCGLFDAAYRPFGKYPKVTVLLTTARVVDWAGTIAGLFIGGTLLSAALGLLCGRVVSCIALFLFALRDIPELEWNLDQIDRPLVRQLIRSGIGFLSFPAGSLLTLQGMVVLVGAQLGGSAVALFNSSRTLARLLAQLSILTGKSMAPEISKLYGAGKNQEADQLVKQLLWTILPLTVLGAVALELLGPTILFHWSHGKIGFDRVVFTWLLIGAICAGYWQIRSTQLTATNRHSLLAAMFLGVSAAALVVAFLTEKAFGLAAAAASTCLVEAAMVCCTAIALSRAKRTSVSAV